MPKFCNQCGRPQGRPHHIIGICDTVRLSDGRVVHANRVKIGGDLREELNEFGLKVVSRNITAEMRAQFEGKKEKP